MTLADDRPADSHYDPTPISRKQQHHISER